MRTFADKRRVGPSVARNLPSPCGPASAEHGVAVRQIIRGSQVQPKLAVGAPDDVYEQEADRVADEVMRISPANDSTSAQINPPHHEPSIQRQNLEDEEELVQAKLPEGALQLKADAYAMPDVEPGLEARIHALQGGGVPLSPAERAFFEPRFGHDFSQVRIHTGPEAAESARAVKAQAFTVGRDVVFGAGAYAPESASRRRLIAHELTHVVQQSRQTEQEIEPATEGRVHAGQMVQRDLLDDITNSRPAAFLNDLLSSITEAPSHALEILGELWTAIREHWVAFTATLTAFLTVEAIIAALAGAPEPTTATKWAAFILQALMLLAMGAFATVELGQVGYWCYSWMSKAWEAQGDPAKISEASKAFCRMLLHIGLLVLSLIGVRAKFRATSSAWEALSSSEATSGSAGATVSGLERARQFGQTLLQELKNLSRGKMTRLVEAVNGQGFSQEEAVVAVEEASKVFGRTARVVQPDGSIVVSSVMPGESIPVFVVESNGNVFGATARLSVSEETLEVSISNIRPWGG